jgi:hypothetical protein
VGTPFRHVVVQPDMALEIAETLVKLETQLGWRVGAQRVRPGAAANRNRLVFVA